MIGKVGRIAASFGWAGGAAAVVFILIFMPFAAVAIERATGWPIAAALAVLIAINLVPLVGQVVLVALAAMGAFALGQDNLAQRRAVPTPEQVAAAPAQAAAAKREPAVPAEGLRVAGRAFEDWRKNVAAPAIQESCLEDVQRRGLTGTSQLDQMARACACYGAAAETVIETGDIADDKLNPTGAFNERLAAEARKLCQRQ